jgi:hypothetical protein
MVSGPARWPAPGRPAACNGPAPVSQIQSMSTGFVQSLTMPGILPSSAGDEANRNQFQINYYKRICSDAESFIDSKAQARKKSYEEAVNACSDTVLHVSKISPSCSGIDIRRNLLGLPRSEEKDRSLLPQPDANKWHAAGAMQEKIEGRPVYYLAISQPEWYKIQLVSMVSLRFALLGLIKPNFPTRSLH